MLFNPSAAGGASANVVKQNRIGVSATGTALGNGGPGILLSANTTNTVVGVDAEGNTIAHNTGIGVEVGGASSTGNGIRGNSIHDNGLLGIDLGSEGVTPNDPGDGDVGPNNLQNFPTGLSAELIGGQIQITGTLDAVSGPDVRAPLLLERRGRSLRQRRGRDLPRLAELGAGPFSFTFAPVPPVAPGAFVTATATDAAGNTSEFSIRSRRRGSGGRRLHRQLRGRARRRHLRRDLHAARRGRRRERGADRRRDRVRDRERATEDLADEQAARVGHPRDRRDLAAGVRRRAADRARRLRRLGRADRRRHRALRRRGGEPDSRARAERVPDERDRRLRPRQQHLRQLHRHERGRHGGRTATAAPASTWRTPRERRSAGRTPPNAT